MFVRAVDTLRRVSHNCAYNNIECSAFPSPIEKRGCDFFKKKKLKISFYSAYREHRELEIFSTLYAWRTMSVLGSVPLFVRGRPVLPKGLRYLFSVWTARTLCMRFHGSTNTRPPVQWSRDASAFLRKYRILYAWGRRRRDPRLF